MGIYATTVVQERIIGIDVLIILFVLHVVGMIVNGIVNNQHLR
jgi:hypothetical protein